MKSKKFRAKKSLGQNFLKSKKILEAVVRAGKLSREDTVLEIGPGKGALTEKLLESAGKVVAVETDYELYEFLKTKFETEIKSGKLILIREDILACDMSRLNLDTGKYKIVANIPYNITGAILKKFLSSPNQPESMVLMVQREVAQRIMGRDKESILSISVKAYGTPKIIAKVPARFFSPKPKVDSAIIKISGISRENFIKGGVNEEKFFEIVRAGFAHKRKKLQSNLKNLLSPYQGEPLVWLEEIGNKRAEDLSPKNWFELARKCYN